MINLKYMFFMLTTLAFTLEAKDVLLKNTDDFPITFSWSETDSQPVFSAGRRARGARATPIFGGSGFASSFTETLEPHSEKTVKIGEQGTPGNYKVTIHHRYSHLNERPSGFNTGSQQGLNEFNLGNTIGDSMELGTIPFIKTILGAQSLIVKSDDSRTQVYAPDLQKIASLSGDINFNLQGPESVQNQ